MPLSEYPNGVSSFGVPLIGPPGLVSQGNYFFVKPYSGKDTNDGKTPATAFKTLATAYAAATADQNDTIFLIAESNTAANTTDYQSATLTWGKDLVHLIGVCAPSTVSQRARIAQLSTATGVSPLLNVTADGCRIENISVFHGVADATSKVCVQVTGQRNYFRNVHFAGMGDTSKTQSVTGAASLKIDGGAENVFDSCVIGLDSATRDADGTEILFDTDATRNVFRNCYIISYIDAATFASVTVADGTGIDRYVIFDNCLFFTKSTNKATTQTSVFSIPAISQGAIILKGGTCAASDGGAVDWDSNNRGIIWNSSVAAAASAAGGILTNQ